MIDDSNFQQTLQRIREEASAARAFFHTWNALNMALGETALRATMNDYRHVDFFITSMEGCFRLFFLSLGKVFDERTNTVSLHLLTKKLEDDGHADFAGDIKAIISDHSRTIKKIRLVRNKSIAHNDLASTREIFKSAGITPNEIEALIDASCRILNAIGESMGFPDRISEGERNVCAVQNLLYSLHYSRLPRMKTLGWDQVQQFFNDYGCVLVGHPEIRWYRESWEALDKAGLTSTTQYRSFELAQTVLKLRALCLLAMYLGMYQAAGPNSKLGGYFLEHPDVPSYLDSLGVEMEEIWNLARVSGMLETSALSYFEDDETDEDQLHEIAMNLVSEENAVIFDALVEHYGGSVELFESLWNSRVSADDAEPFETVVNTMRPQDGKTEVWSYVEERMVGWSWI